MLCAVAEGIRRSSETIIAANDADMARASGLDPAMLDRLRLDSARVEAMAAAVDDISRQPDHLGAVVDQRELPSGIRLEKRRVPIGVILMIYESRPNVTSDAAALCLKSGNCVLLRGGSEACRSNLAIVDAIRPALEAADCVDAIGFVDPSDRASVGQLLAMEGRIDLAIPRGGPGLMKAVAETARIPVIKHDAGNCHVYLDASLEGLEESARAIVVNSKVQRPGVCNACETLLVHRRVADGVLPVIARDLLERGVEIRGDADTRRLVPEAAAASEIDWKTEYLDLVLAIRVVKSIDDAIDHIERFGSGHTECIVTSSEKAADEFLRSVDSASVMINCSTRFADGGEYGLGAEIGISTNRLHARGPMGAEDLTTFQWVLRGDGQVRS